MSLYYFMNNNMCTNNNQGAVGEAVSVDVKTNHSPHLFLCTQYTGIHNIVISKGIYIYVFFLYIFKEIVLKTYTCVKVGYTNTHMYSKRNYIHIQMNIIAFA